MSLKALKGFKMFKSLLKSFQFCFKGTTSSCGHVRRKAPQVQWRCDGERFMAWFAVDFRSQEPFCCSRARSFSRFEGLLVLFAPFVDALRGLCGVSRGASERSCEAENFQVGLGLMRIS